LEPDRRDRPTSPSPRQGQRLHPPRGWFRSPRVMRTQTDTSKRIRVAPRSASTRLTNRNSEEMAGTPNQKSNTPRRCLTSCFPTTPVVRPIRRNCSFPIRSCRRLLSYLWPTDQHTMVLRRYLKGLAARPSWRRGMGMKA